jgi:hypothetical protein
MTTDPRRRVSGPGAGVGVMNQAHDGLTQAVVGARLSAPAI